ncbi:MAG: rhodanese-like domain-containing protein [Saprospiraceae bacterium]|nr:rhodanese-like domain-containing protein [Saprospiraceae bacterium]
MLTFLKELLGFGPKADFKALKAQGALIVDVRTPEEFRADHLKGAVNIPLDRIRKEVAAFQKKKKPVILYCRSGNRSGMAKSMLRSAGIEAYNAGSLGAMRRALR